MHPLLKRTLIFIALMIAGLVLYVKWFDTRADRYDEVAVPYLHDAVPVLAGWQVEPLLPLLSPDARRDFENDQLRNAYLGFSRLGSMLSMQKPQFLSSNSATSNSLGDVEIVEYEVVSEFDSGPARIKLKLLLHDQDYYIHHFGVYSEVFATSN